MKVRKVRLNAEVKFIDQTDMNDAPKVIESMLSSSGVAMVTVTFDDGRETLWMKIAD